MPTKTVTDESFAADVLQTDVPVLVDFWATWCGPCKAMAPALEAIADELAGKAVIAKIDVDASPASPASYGVRGVPTLILFKAGEPIATHVGPLPASRLRAFIEQAL